MPPGFKMGVVFCELCSSRGHLARKQSSAEVSASQTDYKAVPGGSWKLTLEGAVFEVYEDIACFKFHLCHKPCAQFQQNLFIFSA